MGKIRIKTLGVKELEKKEQAEAKKRREVKKQKQADEVVAPGVPPVVDSDVVALQETASKDTDSSDSVDSTDSTATAEKKSSSQARRPKKVAGKNIKASKKHVDAEKQYSLADAVKLLKKMSFAKFDETVEIHINTKENSIKGEVALPHGTGKALKVVVADEALIKKIEAGEIDFDILVATPSFMPKLVPLARILGPKGLMPNPKTGTVTDKPDEAVKKFMGGAVRYKTEPKFPIIHQSIGKLSFSEKQIEENVIAFLGSMKSKDIEKVFLTASMTPSVQLKITSE